MTAWKRRDSDEIGCFAILDMLCNVDFNSNYPEIANIFGGQLFIREQLGLISETLATKSPENVLELKCLLKMAAITLRRFALKHSLSSSTASMKIIRNFMASVELDLQTMTHIASHFIYMLSIELYEIEMQKKAA